MSDTLNYATPAGESDASAIAAILSSAFGNQPDQSREWVGKLDLSDFRIVRAGGEVVGALLLVPMGQYWGGRAAPMTGIAAVGVAPHRRGEGVALHLMRGAVRELAERGVPISGLYPATQHLYRRAGYEQAGTRFTVTLPAARIGVRSAGALKSVRLGDADTEEVKACYARFASRHDGYLDRGPYVWSRIRETREGTAGGFGFRDRSGALRGYVYLTQPKKPSGKYDLRVWDMAGDSAEAMREVLAFLADHRSMADDAIWFTGPHDPFLALLDEQPFTMALHFYWMLRILDVKRALEARGYPPGVRAELHLEVDDDLLESNRGRFTVQVEGGRASVKPGGRGEVRLGVRALAPLYSGLRSAWELRTLGVLEGPDEALAAAAGVFAGAAPATPDMY